MFVASLIGALLLAGPGPASELQLEDSSGKAVTVRLAGEKPAVLFYEDRDGANLNKDLKDELFKRATERGLMSAARLIAIANVRGYGWFPARWFAQAGIRDVEKKFNIQIWADFTGVGGTAPTGLPEKGAAVLLLDREGKVVFRAVGALTPEQRDRFFLTLEALVT